MNSCYQRKVFYNSKVQMALTNSKILYTTDRISVIVSTQTEQDDRNLYLHVYTYYNYNKLL